MLTFPPILEEYQEDLMNRGVDLTLVRQVVGSSFQGSTRNIDKGN